MKKSVGLIVGCFLCVLAVGCIISVKPVDTAAGADNLILEETPPDQSANDAHRNMISNFDDAYYGLVYPDDYCGDYIKDNVLHVVLTSLDSDTVEKYKSYVKYSEDVVFEKQDIPLHVLDEYKDIFWDELVKNGIMPCSAWSDQINNNLIVEVLSDEIDESTNIIEKYIADNCITDITANKIIIQEGSPAEKTLVTLYGGTTLYKNGSADRTLGISGTVDGVDGFVTCGHGASVNMYLKGSTGSIYGRVEYVRYQNNGYGDFAIVYSNGMGVKTNKVFNGSGGYTNIYNTLDVPVVGSSLYRYGYASGQSSVTVTATGVTKSSGGVTIKGLCKASGSISSVGGDSGGPYRQGSYFCGVHYGHEASNNTNVLFTPYQYIRTCSHPLTL